MTVMKDSDNAFFNKEMEKLERQQMGLRDNYNQEIEEFDEFAYTRALRNSKHIEYSWSHNESLTQFYTKLKIHIDIITERNVRMHMKGPKGPWYAHRRPDGCFMCKDIEVIGYLMDLIHSLSDKYPKLTLKDL